jgi:myo-inositol-1(or 4)-monophosphatase
MLPDITTLRTLVVAAAQEELLPRFAATERRFKADGSVVTEADIAMQQRLSERLHAVWPEYRMLGEEMSSDHQREMLQQGDAGLWCLDPLDGTSNFAVGLPFFSVSLALLISRKPVLAMVYDPVRKECFTAVAGKGAWLNGAPLACVPAGLPLRRCIAVVDFKRLKQFGGTLVLRPPFSSQRNFGSVALEWCWLAANRFHVYLHGRQQLWDYAAGALILSEAGGCSETLDGQAIFTHDLPPRSVVAARDSLLFKEWKDWLVAERTK